jgi:KDO2-lipid IV(A) lauroyltransferase
MVDLQQVIASSFSVQLISTLAQVLPPHLGYRLASFLGDQIAHQRNSQVVRAVRANQWVVRGEILEGRALDQATRETLHHSSRCFFDLYHYVQHPESAGRLIVLEPSFQRLVERPEFDRRGLIIIGLHLSNFDLVLQWVCSRGMKPLVLTIPDPQGGRRIEYEMRKRTGINLLPASMSAIRQAFRHLKQGGMVLTGIDRPIPNPEVCPRFFGRPGALPIHHIFLATKAQVPLVIAGTHFHSDGKYHVFASDLLEMDYYPDPSAGALRNAEKVLNIAERFIRRAPQQWSVPLAVWPETVNLV